MDKIVINSAFDYGIDDSLVKIVDNPDHLNRKVASSVRDSWGEVTPEKGRTLVHIIALGAFEKTGANSNSDGFEESVCKKSHKDFVKKSRLYRHHKKTAEEKKDGDVVKSAYNEKMGRVELLLSAIDEKCADWLGDLEKGGAVNFSMGWKCTDGDICSICGNKAHSRDSYCEHLHKTAKAPYGLGKILPDGRKCFTFNREGHWNDISYVDRGADMIAMDLKKLGSADGAECIGGAELAEMMLGHQDSDQVDLFVEKVANLVHKIAKGGIKPVFTSGEIPASTLSKMASEKLEDVFYSLREQNLSVGFKDFCSLISQKLGAQHMDDFASAEENFGEIMLDILSNKVSIKKAASSNTFLPKHFSKKVDLSEVQHYLTGQNKIASIVSAVSIKKLSPKKEITKTAKAVVENYLAYKLSLLSNSKETTEQKILDSIILN
jgi:hypothetical protein